MHIQTTFAAQFDNRCGDSAELEVSDLQTVKAIFEASMKPFCDFSRTGALQFLRPYLFLGFNLHSNLLCCSDRLAKLGGCRLTLLRLMEDHVLN